MLTLDPEMLERFLKNVRRVGYSENLEEQVLLKSSGYKQCSIN
jgi:hypothetical protein